MFKIEKILEKAILENDNVKIEYYSKLGILRVNEKEYRVGKVSFNDLNDAILKTLEKLYGKYKVASFSLTSRTRKEEYFER